MKLIILGDAVNPHIQRWVSYFVKRKFNIHIISFQACNNDYANVHYVRPPKFLFISQITPFWRKVGYIFCILKVRKLILSLSPDIIHAHWASSYGFNAAISGFHPFIVSTWGSEITDSPKKSWIMKMIIRYVLSHADIITATSKMLVQETKKYVRNGKNVYQVPFGIDIDKFAPMKLNEENSLICIGTVRGLEEKYGIQYLIQAFAKVKEIYHNITLLIVGEGSMYKSYLKLTDKLGVSDSVTFTGRVDNDTIVDIMNKIDIFVIPSLSEAFGVSALEASSCGLPVIASNIGGLPEVIIDGKTGFLVTPQNIEELSEKIILLIEDEDMRKKMGHDGRSYIKENYTIEKCGSIMENIYNNIYNNI